MHYEFCLTCSVQKFVLYLNKVIFPSCLKKNIYTNGIPSDKMEKEKSCNNCTFVIRKTTTVYKCILNVMSRSVFNEFGKFFVECVLDL